MNPQMPEVSLRFRFAPILAIVVLLGLWPFGTAYGVIGLVFGIGLLGLCAAIGLPRSIDLMFGLVLALTLFAAQFMGAVFLGLKAGGETNPVVFTTVAIWFVQLAVVVFDIHRSVKTVLIMPPTAAKQEPGSSSTTEELEIGG